MNHRILLAERRGALQHRYLSHVQEAATEILLVREAKRRKEEYVERFKLALVTHDPSAASVLYDEVETEIASDEDVMDTAGKEFKFTPMSGEEAERVLAQMLASPNGTVKMDEEGWD